MPLGSTEFSESLREVFWLPSTQRPDSTVPAMAKNVSRILTKLQALCDEKSKESKEDFDRHRSWLCDTFKANALQQLKSEKIALACPTSAKKPQAARPASPAEAASPSSGSAKKRAREDDKENAPSPGTAPIAHPGSSEQPRRQEVRGEEAPCPAAPAPMAVEEDSQHEPHQMEVDEGGAAPVDVTEKHATRTASTDQPQPKVSTGSTGSGSGGGSVQPNRTQSAQEQLARLSKLREKLKVGKGTPLTSSSAPAPQKASPALRTAEVPWKTAPPPPAVPAAAAAANTPSNTTATSLTESSEVTMEEADAQPGAATGMQSEGLNTATGGGVCNDDAHSPQKPEPVVSGAADQAAAQPSDAGDAQADSLPAQKKLKTEQNAAPNPSVQATGAAAQTTTAAMIEQVGNICTAVTSFLPLVQPTVEAPAPADNRGKVKVKALEAAQACKDTESRRAVDGGASRQPGLPVKDRQQLARERREKLEQEKQQAQKDKELAREKREAARRLQEDQERAKKEDERRQRERARAAAAQTAAQP